MSKNSKQKGNRYELEIAKKLTKWWGHDFHRVPQSGGLGWEADNRVAGDIIPGPNANFPFTVECKNRESGNWTLESIMLKKHDVNNWWAQAVNDSRRVETVPMLVFTRNYAEDFVMIPYKESVYKDLEEAEQPVMRTVVEYDIEVTKQVERFDVLVTTYEGLSTFAPEYWQEADLDKWDEFSRLSGEHQVPEENVEDIIGKLKK